VPAQAADADGSQEERPPEDRASGRREDGARLYARYERELAAGRTAAAEALLVVLERVPGWEAKARAERKRLKARRAARKAQEKAERQRAASKKTASKRTASKKTASEAAGKTTQGAPAEPGEPASAPPTKPSSADE